MPIDSSGQHLLLLADTSGWLYDNVLIADANDSPACGYGSVFQDWITGSAWQQPPAHPLPQHWGHSAPPFLSAIPANHAVPVYQSPLSCF